MKRILFSAVLISAVSSAFAEAYVTNVLVRQRRPWSEKIDIDFTVGGERADVDFTATWEGQPDPVPLLPAAGLSGRACGILGDGGHVSWDPVVAGHALPIRNLRVTASAHPVSERTWLVIDLQTGEHQYFASAPDEGWTADDTYRTTKMVFRRFPATTFTQGYTSAQKKMLNANGANDWWTNMIGLRQVTLSDDYYMAIFRVTLGQSEWIRNVSKKTTGDKALVARYYTYTTTAGSYKEYRGDTNETDDVMWPRTGYKVSADSAFGKFRTLTGNRFVIDFPTEAQWENASRGGATTVWGHGGEDGMSVDAFTNTLAIVYSPLSAKVGLAQPNNAYGVYNMTAGANEQCLDQWSANYDTGAVTDPIGPNVELSTHVCKGVGNSSPTGSAGKGTPGARISNGLDVGRNASYGNVVARPCIHLNSVFH